MNNGCRSLTKKLVLNKWRNFIFFSKFHFNNHAREDINIGQDCLSHYLSITIFQYVPRPRDMMRNCCVSIIDFQLLVCHIVCHIMCHIIYHIICHMICHIICHIMYHCKVSTFDAGPPLQGQLKNNIKIIRK